MKRLAILSLLSLTQCHFGLPDERAVVATPSYETDIRPIFEDHCVLCHGLPANRGAPTYFRLDVYEDSSTLDGANTMSFEAERRIHEGSMPPAADWGDGLGDNDKQTILNWVNQGALP